MKDLPIQIDEVDKVFHVADVHIRNYKRHDEYKQIFNQLYQQIEDRKTDNSLIVVVGDVVHSKADMSPELVEMVREFLSSLANIRPTILTPGNHDCFTPDHEVLTENNGWVEIGDYVNNKSKDPVATFNRSSEEVEFQRPVRHIKKPFNGKLTHIKGKEIDQVSTPTHRTIHQFSARPDDQYYVKDAADIKENYLVPTGTVPNEKISNINPYASLLGFSFGDGTFVLKNEDTGSCRVQFRLKNESGIGFLKDTFNKLDYDTSFRESENEVTTVCIYSDLAKSIYEYFEGKKQIPWNFLSEDDAFIESFIYGYLKADGHQNESGGWNFVSVDKQSVDVLVSAARTLGYKSHLSFDREIYGNYENSKRQYKGYIRASENHSRTRVKEKNVVEYDGDVYCLTVPNETLLVRRNDKIWVSGNCLENNPDRLDALTPIVQAMGDPNLYYLFETGLYRVGDTVFSHMNFMDDPEDYVLAKDIPDKYRKIALYHDVVDRAVTDYGYVLKSDEVSEQTFVGFDSVLLGDIHRRQRVSEYRIEKMEVPKSEVEKYLNAGWEIAEE